MSFINLQRVSPVTSCCIFRERLHHVQCQHWRFFSPPPLPKNLLKGSRDLLRGSRFFILGIVLRPFLSQVSPISFQSFASCWVAAYLVMAQDVRGKEAGRLCTADPEGAKRHRALAPLRLPTEATRVLTRAPPSRMAQLANKSEPTRVRWPPCANRSKWNSADPQVHNPALLPLPWIATWPDTESWAPSHPWGLWGCGALSLLSLFVAVQLQAKGKNHAESTIMIYAVLHH